MNQPKTGNRKPKTLIYWAALAAACLLAGCAGVPPPKPQPQALPSYRETRPPQAVLLDQALSEFSGAPYLAGGSTPAGVDCSGLVQAVFHRAGINLPRTVAQQYREGRSLNLGELRFGDVVFFNRYCQTKKNLDYWTASMFPQAQTLEVCHNGIYIGQDRFIHASPRGVAASRLDAEVWRRAYVGARRYLPEDCILLGKASVPA